MGEKLKSIGGFFKRGAEWIRKMIKVVKTIISTPLKWIVLIILIIVLLYILVQTIVVTLKRVLGVEDAGIKSTADYQILRQLQESGYNELMPSDELAKYMNYEYAVLMDAARFFSETGVIEHEHIDVANPVDISQLNPEEQSKLFDLATKGADSKEYKDFISDVRTRLKSEEPKKELDEKTAYAETRIKEYEDDLKKLNDLKEKADKDETQKKVYENALKKYGSDYGAKKTNKEYTKETVEAAINSKIERAKNDISAAKAAYEALDKGKRDAKSDEEIEELASKLSEALKTLSRRYGPDKFNNDNSSIDLFYKVVKNDSFDGQESLVPYVRIFRRATRYTYHYMVPEGSDIRTWIDGKSNDELYNFTIDYYNPHVDVGAADYNLGTIDTSGLFNLMSIYTINSDLNGRNKDLWRGSPAPGGGAPLDTKKVYKADEDFIEMGDMGSATYEIPFKVLVNKFLPKAQLLSTWYMLKDSSDDGTVANLLEDIQEIYDYYCLYGEEEGESSRALMIRYANLLGIRLKDRKTQELLNDPENHKGTRLIDEEKVLNEIQLTNKISFVIFERLNLAFFTGGKLEFAKSKYRAVTDLMQAGQFDINFDIKYKYSYNNVKMKEDSTFENYGSRRHETGTISGEEAREIFESELEKILNGTEPITIKGGDGGETTVYLHGLTGMGIHSSENRPKDILPLKFVGLKTNNQNGGIYDKDGNQGYIFENDLTGYYHLTSSSDNSGDYTKYNIDDFGISSIKSAIAEKLQALIEENYKDWKPDELPHTDRLPSTEEEIEKALGTPDKLYKRNITFDEFTIDFGSDNDKISIPEDKIYAMFTLEDVEFQIKQIINEKNMPTYFPVEAHTWSRDIEYTNALAEGARFNKGNIAGVKLMATGLMQFGSLKFGVSSDSTWRVDMYAPLFTEVREKDFIAMIAEWETVADGGDFAADTYIRDLYKLIQYSKPEYDKATHVESTVDTYNYIYINIPDEILYYDEDTSDYAFWLNHLQASTADPIEPEENITMRSRIPIMKWQQVDYSLYDECYDESTGKYRVYALWPEGAYMARSIYSISANATKTTNDMVESWGGWKWNGRHGGLDLYARSSTDRLVRAYASRIKTVSSDGGKSVSIKVVKGSDALISNEGVVGGSTGSDSTSENSATKKINKLIDEVNALDSKFLSRDEITEKLENIRQKGEDIMDEAQLYPEEDYNTVIQQYYALLASLESVGDMAGDSDIDSLDQIVEAPKEDPTYPKGSKHIGGLPRYDVYNSKDSATSIVMDGTTYSFDSSGAALYAYELYRMTRATGDAEESANTLTLKLLEETKNSPIVSVAPGIVTEVAARPGCGFMVKVTHTTDKKIATSYLHLKRYPEVQLYEYVGAGTVLGYEGTTGASKGLHLHFEIKTREYGSGSFEVPYLYPFFNPFYKAEDEGEPAYDLSNEHWSLIRTVFPVGQVVGEDIISYLGMDSNGQLNGNEPCYVGLRREYLKEVGYPGVINQVSVDSKGNIALKNNVPTIPLVPDCNDLYTANDERLSEGFLDTPETLSVTGNIEYSSRRVKAYEVYFDKTFLEMVKDYSGYIFTGSIANPTPHIYDNKKPLFGDNGFNYSVQNWKQLELALQEEVVKAGFGTRAGVVAAARFLAGMDHSIPYLGQKTTNADVGIYARRGLNATWGQTVYCGGVMYSHNGFDCTGYVNWCLINGGIKPEGYNSSGSGLGGDLITTNSAIETGRIKVGDILESRSYGISGYTGETGWNFTHTGILIGISGDTYYVAQEGAGRLHIAEYKKEDFTTDNLNFVWVDKSDDEPLYPAEGNMDKVTNQTWYNCDKKAVAKF